MYLQKIKIKNFGVYNGENFIVFDKDNNKNICLIDGNNGYGKTTLYKAIYYCLYGVMEKYKERMDNMNEHALSNGDLRTSVELHFIHDGKYYQITRSLATLKYPITQINDISEAVTMLEDGITVKNIDNRINDILPREASQFFFFDGEDIKRYASLENTEATREAIELVLGIPAIRYALQDLDSIQKDLIRKRRKEMEKSKNQAELAEREEANIQNIKLREEKIEEAKKKKKKFLSIKEELLEKLEEQKILKPIVEQRRELTKRQVEIDNKIKDIKGEEKEMYEKLSYLILKPLIKKAYKKIVEESKAKQRIFDEIASAKAMIKEIDRILRTRKCICGDTINNLGEKILKEKQKTYQKKIKESDKFTIGDILEKQQKLSEILRIVDKIEGDYKNILRRKEELLFESDEISSELKSINKKLHSTMSQEGYEKLEEKYKEVDLEIVKLAQDIKWAEEEYKALSSEQEKIQNEILESKIRSPKLEKLNKQIGLINKSKDALNSYLEKIIAIKKRRIEKEASEVFKELTNKKGVFVGVKINDDYTIRIVDKDGGIVDTDKISAGEKQILALSFIAGLRKSTDKQAPVVMDTPFGRLDHEHKTNVMKFLHRLANQIILLATDEDVNEDNIDIIAPYIGKKYEIQFQPDKKSSVLMEVG